MKICPLCNAEYDSRIEYCFRDGTKLDSSTSSSGTTHKLATGHLDSMGKHSMDSMETLDNISIHDLLQIGGRFQGFGEFTPIEAPESKDGNTTIASRSELHSELEQDGSGKNAVEQTGMLSDDEDIEDILDSLGGDIGAHLDDTLDGIQVGQILDDSSLDIGKSNELLPGDTLDVLVDELDVPKMTESDLNRFHEDSVPELDELDAWEESGPIMQEAARNALAQHKMRTDDGFTGNREESIVETTVESKRSLPIPVLVGGLVFLIGGGIWAMFGDSDNLESTDSEVVGVADQEVPAVPKVPVVTVKDATGNIDPSTTKSASTPSEEVEKVEQTEKAEKSTLDNKQTNANENVTKPVEKVKKPSPSVESTPTRPSTNTVSNTKPSKSAAKPKPKKRTPPPKPKTKPKPIPQKDPQEDNGWGAVQSGGWGSSTCGVKVSSNVASAKVYIDGEQKGSVGKKLTVDCGQHKMEVRSDGYKSVTRSIDLMSDASFTIELTR